MEKLDLHNLHYEDVKRSLIRKIEMYWGSNEVLEIITGHSSKMRGIVTKLLDEYSLDYQIGGNLGINDGMIRVEMK